MNLLKNPYILLGISIVLGIFGQFSFKHGLNMIIGSAPFNLSHVSDMKAFIIKLRGSDEGLAVLLREKFTPETMDMVNNYNEAAPPSEELQKSIVDNLNKIINGASIYEKERFAGVELSPNTLKLIDKNPTGKDLVRLNRSLLVESNKGILTPASVELSPKIILIFFTPFIFMGLSFYVLSTFTWLAGLSRIPLSIAYPMLSTGYLIIFIISVLFLGEKYTHAKLIANLLIIGGITLLFQGK